MVRSTAHLAASRVTALAEAKGFSVNAMSKGTGIPRMTLTRRLTGNSPFTVAELDALADLLGTTTHELTQPEEIPA